MTEILPVSALNTYVRSILESDDNLKDIKVKGEISNFTRNYKSGHCYFSLVDETASVKAVMFKADAQQMDFTPEDGMRVLARGRVTLYEKSGSYQLILRDIFPDGAGALQKAFEQVRARLAAEGLFAPEAKKPLPAFPRRIGLVTSKTGAALQDILAVAARRNPMMSFLLAPVSVQGFDAAKEIAQAVRRLDAVADVDLIIVARGGGASEDLWVFNDESLARTVFVAAKPVVSAIGHEIDTTILDFVADVRAQTPSAAAELAIPDVYGTVAGLEKVFTNIEYYIHQKLQTCYNQLSGAATGFSAGQTGKAIDRKSNQLSAFAGRLQGAMETRLERAQNRLEKDASVAAGLNPYHVLARGYGVVQKERQILKGVGTIKPGDALHVFMADGSFYCDVERVSQERIEDGKTQKEL